MSNSYQQICPQCGKVLVGNPVRCDECGYPLHAGHASAGRESSRAPLLPDFKPAIKVVSVLAVMGFILWLGYWAVNRIYRSVEEANPYPLDRVEATTEFFTAIYQKDYNTCYRLLSSKRKVATAIKRNTHENYDRHFARIGSYLEKYAGENYLESMAVSAGGSSVTFDGITLTVHFDTSIGFDDKEHYAVDNVNEFPMDVAPGIGIEQYNRTLSRAIESMGDIGGSKDDSDNPAEIIKHREGESKNEREKRIIASFKNERQLDTRHILFDWILTEFPDSPATTRFLQDVADDEMEVAHLRQMAQNILDQL
jgi:hypothetical protein